VSVRALILDPADQVLLVRFDWEALDLAGGFWANPGGGIEVGETRLDALRRELREEIGMEIGALGPEVWTKTARFDMADWDGQVDHIHLVRTEHFDPQPALSAAELAAENLHEIRWWPPAQELREGCANFAPRALPALLARLRDEGIPTTPIKVEGF
jgi:8-oxo-dGTP diphosphatase